MLTANVEDVESEVPPVKVKRSRRSKYLRLSVTPGGLVKLSAPIFVADQTIQEFLNRHSDWIDKALKKLSITPKLRLASGNSLTIKGNTWELVVHEQQNSSKCSVRFDQATNEIHFFGLNRGNEDELRHLLKKRLKKYARAQITNDLSQIAAQYGFDFSAISIREQRTRWGSCSSDGRLSFNWKIILAPVEVYYYVLFHELAHTKQHNHSSSFWSIVEQLQPTYKLHKTWLKSHAGELELI